MMHIILIILTATGICVAAIVGLLAIFALVYYLVGFFEYADIDIAYIFEKRGEAAGKRFTEKRRKKNNNIKE